MQGFNLDCEVWAGFGVSKLKVVFRLSQLEGFDSLDYLSLAFESSLRASV